MRPRFAAPIVSPLAIVRIRGVIALLRRAAVVGCLVLGAAVAQEAPLLTANLPEAMRLQAAGRHEEAIPMFEALFMTHKRQLGERHAQTVQVAMKLGLSYQALGRLDKALPLDERLLSVMVADRGRHHRDTLAAMVNLATTYHDLGQNTRALRLQTTALQLAETHLGADDPVTIRALVSMATVHAGLKRFAEATEFDRLVLERRRRSLPAAHPDIESALNNLSSSLSSLGKPDESVPLAEEALRLRRARLGDAHPATLISSTNLAEAYIEAKRYADAIAVLQPVLDRRRIHPGPGHQHTLYTQYSLAAALHESGRTADALAVAAEAVEGIETRRLMPDLGTADRQSLLAAFAQDLRLYARMHGLAGGAHWPVGFEIAERSKARTLLESMVQMAAERRAALPADERRALEDLERRAAQLEQLIAEHALSASPDIAKGVSLATQRRELGRMLSEERQGLLRRHPALAEALQLSRPEPASVAARMGPDATYLSWVLDDDGQAQAWLLGPDGAPSFVDLGRHPGLVASLVAYRAVLTSRRPPAIWQMPDGSLTLGDGKPPAGGRRFQGDAEQAIGGHLSKVLLGPLRARLAGAPQWIMSADGPLAFLPVEALPLPWGAGRVAEQHSVTRVQSLAVLDQLHRRRDERHAVGPRRVLLAMGDPQYDAADTRSIVRGATRGWRLAPSAQRSRRSVSGAESGPADIPLSALRWGNLPGTRTEVRAAARALASTAVTPASGIDLFTGAQASEERLAALQATGRLRDYRYLLFATHGYLAAEPALTSIVLSQRHKTRRHDGYVTAAEWARLDLGSELAVFSACDTGAGTALPGEGVLGLPYSLFVAGNQNTLLTLWPVDDEATAEFMARLFRRLAAGDAPAAALTATRREFMRHPRWGAPRHWAPFILYGA